jgi:hypothetical protein
MQPMGYSNYTKIVFCSEPFWVLGISTSTPYWLESFVFWFLRAVRLLASFGLPFFVSPVMVPAINLSLDFCVPFPSLESNRFVMSHHIFQYWIPVL